MSVSLYMDVQVPRGVTAGLRARGVDVLTAQEDGQSATPDPELLDRASALRRVLFTMDDDLPTEAARRMRTGETFGGVIYVHQLRLTVGQIVEELELIAKADDLASYINRVQFLPLSK